jgi:hypothetical protein
MAIVVSLYRGYLRKSLINLLGGLYMRVTHKVPMDIEDSDNRAQIPYAVAIAAGVVLAFWYIHFYTS